MSEEDLFSTKKRKLDSQFAKASSNTYENAETYLYHKESATSIELPDPVTSNIPESQIFNELVGLERSIDILLDEKKKHIKHFLTRTNCQLISKKLKINISYSLDFDKNEITLVIRSDSLKDCDHPKKFTTFVKKLFVDFDESVFSNPEDFLLSPTDNKTPSSSANSSQTAQNFKNVVCVEWDHYTAFNDLDAFTITKKFDLKKKQLLLKKVQENLLSTKKDEKMEQKDEKASGKKKFNFENSDLEENLNLEDEKAQKKSKVSIFIDILHEPELFCVSKALEKLIHENLISEKLSDGTFQIPSDKPLFSFRQIIDYFWKYCISKKRIDFDNFTIYNFANDENLKDVLKTGSDGAGETFPLQNIIDKLKEHIFFPPPLQIELPVSFNNEKNTFSSEKMEIEVDVFVAKQEKLELNVLSGWDDFFKTNKIDFKDIKALNDSIKKAVRDIQQRKSKRDFFQRFAQNPIKFMYEFICSGTADLKDASAVRNFGSPADNNSMWASPAAAEAVKIFFNEDAISQSLTENGEKNE